MIAGGIAGGIAGVITSRGTDTASSSAQALTPVDDGASALQLLAMPAGFQQGNGELAAPARQLPTDQNQRIPRNNPNPILRLKGETGAPHSGSAAAQPHLFTNRAMFRYVV